jgi:outer membrane protein
MKDILAKILILLMLVPAVTYAEIKIGYVMVEKVLKQAPQTAASNKKLEKEFKSRSEKLKKEIKAIQAKEKSYKKNSVTMSKTERESAIKTIQNSKLDIQRMERALREDIDLRRREEISKLQVRINKAVETVAKKESYDLILYQSVAYANKNVDITDVIIEALGAKKAD